MKIQFGKFSFVLFGLLLPLAAMSTCYDKINVAAAETYSDCHCNIDKQKICSTDDTRRGDDTCGSVVEGTGVKCELSNTTPYSLRTCAEATCVLGTFGAYKCAWSDLHQYYPNVNPYPAHSCP